MAPRPETPMAAGATSVYLVAASACPTDLFGQLRNALGACCGGEAAVLTPECIERSARAELGEEEAAHVLGARRLSAIDGAELVVAELSGADASVGAEVMYALHRRRVAVLCLWRRGEGGAFAAGLPEHPLLTAHEYADADAATALVEAFATPPEQPGRIFVVEGGDGAGKQTQSAMMRERLRAEGYPVSTLDYPHDAAQHGQLIRTLLSGAKGDLKDLNPLLFASLYAENRHDTGPLLRAWLRRGDNVVLDRYVEANFGHQASKLPPDERPALIAQLAEFEHGWLELPRAHRVVYLDLPPAEAAKAMATDGSRAALDIHETAGADYKAAVRSTFLWCAENFEHWVRVPCVDGAGARYGKPELSDVMWSRLAGEFVNRKEPAAAK